MNFPFVSIIIPVYNRKGPLEKCLQSLRALDWPQDRLEIRVADDGSEEDLFPLIRSFGAIHLKDVHRTVVEDARIEKLDYRQASARGVWTELGTGDIDFRSIFRFLQDKRWAGWVIVETDHTTFPTALESSRASRQYLREIIGV